GRDAVVLLEEVAQPLPTADVGERNGRGATASAVDCCARPTSRPSPFVTLLEPFCQNSRASFGRDDCDSTGYGDRLEIRDTPGVLTKRTLSGVLRLGGYAFLARSRGRRMPDRVLLN